MESHPQEAVAAVEGEADTRIFLRGMLDLQVAGRVLDVALRASERGLDTVVHCSELGSMDTSVLQILLALRTELGAQNRRLTLEAPSERVRSFLRAGGALGLLEGSDDAPPEDSVTVADGVFFFS